MQSVGSLFKNERIKQGLTKKDVEKAIRIRERVISQMEDDDWKEFASKVYITGLIKNYSRYLGLDPDKMIAYFRRDYEKKEEIGFKRRVDLRYFKSQTRLMIAFGVIMIFFIFGSYFGYQLHIYFKPPEVAILLPVESEFFSKDRITVVGETEPDATIEIFGERIFQDQSGRFEYDFPLSEGENELLITITGANGRVVTVRRVFYLEP